MVARLLGATVVLTEQDELLSLLDRNLAKNFDGDREGIRHAALDWERKEDTDCILTSLQPTTERPVIIPVASGSAGRVGGAVARKEGHAAAREALGPLDDGQLSLTTLQGNGRAATGAVGGKGGGEVIDRRSTRLQFILCAE